MRINSYSPSLSSYQQNNIDISKNFQQIASGKKVQSAADNPAYSVILQGMQSQANGYNQAYRNTQDTTSLLNVSQGAMSNSQDTIDQMRSLSVQAANGTLTDQDRSFIQLQMDQLGKQLDSNATNTNFNGIYTNNGSLSNFATQIGANAGQSSSFSIDDLSSKAIGINTDVSTQAAAENSLKTIDSAQEKLSSSQSQVGALTNSLEKTSDNLIQSEYNINAAKSSMGDTDIAASITALDANKIKQYANIFAMKQNMLLQKSSLSLLA